MKNKLLALIALLIVGCSCPPLTFSTYDMVNLSNHTVYITAEYNSDSGFPDSLALKSGETFNWKNNYDAFYAMSKVYRMYFDSDKIYIEFIDFYSERNPASSINYEWEHIEKYRIKYTYTITESDYELAVKQTKERNRKEGNT